MLAPVWAIAAAAPMTRTMFFGLMTASPKARPADRRASKRSMVRSQLGSLGLASPRGRRWYWRYATITRARPPRSLTTLSQVAGWPSELADAPLEMSRTMAPTSASDTTQEARNAGPFTRPRGVESISTTATMASGLTATATA